MAATGCPAVEHMDAGQAIVALSAWSGQTVQKLADKAGLDKELSNAWLAGLVQRDAASNRGCEQVG